MSCAIIPAGEASRLSFDVPADAHLAALRLAMESTPPLMTRRHAWSSAVFRWSGRVPVLTAAPRIGTLVRGSSPNRCLFVRVMIHPEWRNTPQAQYPFGGSRRSR